MGVLTSPAEWREAGRYFEWQGHRIFYRDEGEGDVLILSHGFPTASWDWHKVWPALTGRYRCIAVDYLGFGFSDKPRSHSYTILSQADLFEALLAELGVDEVHVLSHDYGNSIAQELIARTEEGSASVRVRSICYLNGGIFMSCVHRTRMQNILESPLGKVVQHLMNGRKFGRSFARIFGPETQPSPEELEGFWALIDYNNGKGVMHDVIQYMGERLRQEARWTKHMAATSIPQRLIIGMLDPVSGANIAEAYRSRIPGADIVELARIGHYPQTEAPELVLESCFEFFSTTLKVSHDE